MVNLVAFDTEKELCELTGLSETELWKKGFNLDDWDIGFQSDKNCIEPQRLMILKMVMMKMN